MPIRALLLAALALAAAASARAQVGTCEDAAWARDLRARYPGELNRLFDMERQQQSAWSSRASEIGARVVAAGAATRDAQDATLLALARSAPNTAYDAQAQQAGDKFRARNSLLTATLPLARIDPLRPDLAWCLMATSALEALHAKLDAEIASWALLDRELLADAARKGVAIAP